MTSRHPKDRAQSIYPKTLLLPMDWLRFMELSPFSRIRKHLRFTDGNIK